MNTERFNKLQELILQRLAFNGGNMSRSSLMSIFYSNEHEEVETVVRTLKNKLVLTEALGRISLKS